MNIFKKSALRVLFCCLIMAGFLVSPAKALATYSDAGLIISNNLLSGTGASRIHSFTYTVTSIPSGTALKVQFSSDNLNWYDSTGTPNAWNTLSTGTNTIDLSAINFFRSGYFYYKMFFTSDGTDTPVVDSIVLNYIDDYTVYATYNTSGTLTSTNLLSGQTVTSINSFTYTATDIPSGTGITAQFSQDSTNWYSSAGVLNNSDTLSVGTNTVSLSALAWTGANFYYRMILTSTNGTDTPVLDSVQVNFSQPGTFYWVGGSGNWSDATNHWATTSGGSPGSANTPTSVDSVVFDSNSGTGTVTIDADQSINSFTLNSANITITASNNLTVSGNWTNTAGTFTAGSKTVTMNGTAQTISGNTTFYNLTFNNVAGTWTLPANLTVNNLTIGGGTLKANGKNITVNGVFSNAGNLELTNSETLNLTADTDSGTVTYTGTGTQTTWNYPGNFYNLTIDAVGGTYKLPANLTVNGNLTLTNGVLDLNGFNLAVSGNISRSNGSFANTAGRTLTLNGTNQTIDPGNVSWDTVNVSSNTTAGSNLTISNVLSIASSKVLALLNYVWSLTNSLVNNGTITRTSGRIATASASLAMTDSSYETQTGFSLGIDKIYLTVFDQSGNLSGTSADTLTNAVTVTCGSDSETLSLTETGNQTSVFRYTSGMNVALSYGSHTSGNGTLECLDDSTITATYTDPYDSSDTQTVTAIATIDTKPTAPSNLVGTAQSSTSIKWTWTDNSNNETGFRIYDTSGNLIGTTASNNYTENNLAKGSSYSRKVAAYNKAGNSSYSTTVTVITPAEPTAPSGLSGTAVNSSSIRWSWTDNSNDETGFKLYDSSGNLVATVSTANATSYTETGLTKATSYTRKVAAYNNDGTSSFSSNASATTGNSFPDKPTISSPDNGAIIDNMRPTFSFKEVTGDDDGISGYDLIIDDGKTWVKTINLASNIFSYTLKDIESLSEGSHDWKVRVKDGVGNSTTSDSRTFIIDITSPLLSSLKISNNRLLTNKNIDADYVTIDNQPTITALFTDNAGLKTATFTLNNQTSFHSFFDKEFSLIGTSGDTKDKEVTFTSPTILSSGNYILTITVTDIGNHKSSYTKTIFIGTTEDEAKDIPLAKKVNTISDLVQTIKEGKTPSRTIPAFQLPELIRQTALRLNTQEQNLQIFLSKLMPKNILSNYNHQIVNVEQNLSKSYKNLANQITSPLAKAFDQQKNILAFWQNVQKAVQAGRDNRLALALKNEDWMDKTFEPIMAIFPSIRFGSLVALDNYYGRESLPLAINNVTIVSVAKTSAVISWETPRIARAKVNYGTSTSYGQEIHIDEYNSKQTATLKNLKPNTKYYFEIIITDRFDKQTYDAFYTFNTEK